MVLPEPRSQVADIQDLLRAAAVTLQPRMQGLLYHLLCPLWALSTFLCPPRTGELPEGRGYTFSFVNCTEQFTKHTT